MENKIFADFPDQQNELLDPSVKHIDTLNENVLASKNFFSQKKKKFLLVWSILFASIIFIVIRFLLNLNFLSFFKSVYDISGTPHFLATIIIGFSTFWVCDVFIRVKVLKEKLGIRLSKVTKFEWLNFSIVSFIIQSITPFSIGSEPYSIWWLNKKGISFKESSAVVAVTSVCWFIGQFLITWPSFIFITVKNWSKISSGQISATYWFVLAGLFVDIAVSLFIFIISYSSRFHYFISKATNSLKKYFGFNYLTDDEIFKKFLVDSGFKKVYIFYLLDKSTLRVILWYLLNNLWVYLLFVLIHGRFNHSSWNSEASFNSYNLINVSITATNFFPLPSSEGSLQIIVTELLKGIPVSESETQFNSETIFLWRFFYKYLGLFIGFIFVFVFGFSSERNRFSRLKSAARIDLEPTF